MPEPLDDGPFFHGTVADLRPGELLTAGRRSNYRPEVAPRLLHRAGRRRRPGCRARRGARARRSVPHVYRVEPAGPYEDDPNVTDKKFPGNPTRSYRSRAPRRVLEEVTGWPRLTPEALQAWRDRLAVLLSSPRGEIVD